MLLIDDTQLKALKQVDTSFNKRMNNLMTSIKITLINMNEL